MYGSQLPMIELYRSLWDYDGADAYFEVIKPWVNENADECRWFNTMALHNVNQIIKATNEDLCRLYAVSRVTTILLLNKQLRWAAKDTYPVPSIGNEDYLRFHRALGIHVPEPSPYHPFFHEIVAVNPSDSTDAPIKVIEEIWPPLMLGNMMYCLAGCIVTGGTKHIVKDIAERSKMYWTFRRFNRPCEDWSYGWGSNSQWRTEFRRDYKLSGGYFFNVDGEHSLNHATHQIDELDVSTAIELVRNRCLIRTVANDTDLCPYLYSYDELS
jgi:hypothetical protein